MFGLGIPELLIIFAIVLLVFGANRVPELAKSLGKGIIQFRQVKDGIEREVQDLTDITPSPSRESSDASAKPKLDADQKKARPRERDEGGRCPP